MILVYIYIYIKICNFISRPYHGPSLLNQASGITGSCVNLQLHQWQRVFLSLSLFLSLSNPLSLFSREETSPNNHALCLNALATHVRRPKWLPRQWGDALLTASLQRIVNSADSLSPPSLLGWSFPHWGLNSRMPLTGSQPMFRPPCVQLLLSYRNLHCEHNSFAVFGFQDKALL